MMDKITIKDYIKILDFYNLPIPKSNKHIKTEAEKILSEKLCRCIKKIDAITKNEPRSIGICTKTIFNRKGLTRGKFRCKGNKFATFRKTKKQKKLKY